jgi:hypothetical protein
MHEDKTGRRLLGWEDYCIADYAMIPDVTLAALHRYVEEGCPTGDSLRAVLVHDLFWALFAANAQNLPVLKQICLLIHNYAPPTCHGSEKAVDDWITVGGCRGWEAQQARFREQQEAADVV